VGVLLYPHKGVPPTQSHWKGPAEVLGRITEDTSTEDTPPEDAVGRPGSAGHQDTRLCRG